MIHTICFFETLYIGMKHIGTILHGKRVCQLTNNGVARLKGREEIAGFAAPINDCQSSSTKHLSQLHNIILLKMDKILPLAIEIWILQAIQSHICWGCARLLL